MRVVTFWQNRDALLSHGPLSSLDCIRASGLAGAWQASVREWDENERKGFVSKCLSMSLLSTRCSIKILTSRV